VIREFALNVAAPPAWSGRTGARSELNVAAQQRLVRVVFLTGPAPRKGCADYAVTPISVLARAEIDWRPPVAHVTVLVAAGALALLRWTRPRPPRLPSGLLGRGTHAATTVHRSPSRRSTSRSARPVGKRDLPEVTPVGPPGPSLLGCCQVWRCSADGGHFRHSRAGHRTGAGGSSFHGTHFQLCRRVRRSVQVVPQPCHKHRSSPVVRGQQRSA
jgi:hypothetical protein